MSAERIPPLKAVMTPFPWSVSSDTPLARARVLMHEHAVHHLPVTEDHRLVGVVTERDIRRLLESRLGLAGEEGLIVSDAMSEDVYSVDLDTPLDHALEVMAGDHLGCTLVTRENRIAGILTSTDVCRLFAEHLGRMRPHGNDIA